MHKLYVVYADNGERFSDYSEWPVAAYLDEEQADEHVRLAKERKRELSDRFHEQYQEYLKREGPYPQLNQVNEYNIIKEGWSGNFWTAELNLFESVDEFLASREKEDE